MMKNKIKHIAIIGLGLVGGSLAKALKEKGFYIVGIDLNKSTIRLAKRTKIINKGSTKLSSTILEDVDLIFIATPLNLITTYIKAISKLKLKKQIIITDVGSTKTEICNYVKSIFSNLPPLWGEARSTKLSGQSLRQRRIRLRRTISNLVFIGGHPMAGNEKAGFENSDKNLFQGYSWILTPNIKNQLTNIALENIKYLIKRIGSKPIITSPEKHDKAVALISHLPLIASIGLCKVIENLKDNKLKRLALNIASSGFKDSTRIASGNPLMNLNLINFNLKELTNLVPNYNQELTKLIKKANSNHKNLKNEIIKTYKWRKKLF